jgi:hypothetical protein
LPDALVFGDGIHQQAAFGEAPGEGFLTVDIEAGIGGIDADFGVPMVRRAEADGIEAGELEQIAVLSEGFAIGVLIMAVHLALGRSQLVGIHIADGDDANAANPQEIAHVGIPHRPAADDGDGDLVIDRAILGAQPGHGGDSEGGDAGGKELAARDGLGGGVHRVVDLRAIPSGSFTSKRSALAAWLSVAQMDVTKSGIASNKTPHDSWFDAHFA